MDSIEYLPVPCHYCCYSRNMPVDRAHIYIINTSRCILYGCLCQFILFLQPPNLKVFFYKFPLLPFWRRSLIHATLVDPSSQQAPWNMLHPPPQFSLEDASINEMWRDGDPVTAKFQSFSQTKCPVSLVYYEFWSCSVTGRTKIFRSNRPIIKLFRSDQFFLAVSCLFVHLSKLMEARTMPEKGTKRCPSKIDAPLTWKKQPFKSPK